MERVTIEAELRPAGSRDALRQARQAGRVPGILYGGKGETLPVQVQPRKLIPVLGVERKHNRLFQLALAGGENSLVMVAEAQWHPLKGTLTHIDFKRVLMDQKIHVPLSVVPTGLAEGVKMQGGVFEVVHHQVQVECLPADMPDELSVDVTSLGLNQSIRVSDLQKMVGDKVRILLDSNAVVFHIVAPRAEEEVKPAEALAGEAAAAEPEVIKKGKAETEGEEGAEAKAGAKEGKEAKDAKEGKKK